MDNTDIFDRATASRGGRLDPTTTHPATAKSLDYAASRARGFLRSAAVALPNLPPIHFDFIDNWSFNAVAFRRDGTCFIGVYRGALATLAVLFDRMLADPRILPFLGDSEKESPDLPLLPGLGANFTRSVASVTPFSRPRDPVRQLYASKLTDLAFDFLIAHEFAHIANGHLDYCADRGLLAIDEAQAMSRDAENALVSRTLEMDADATAVWLSLGSEWRRIVGEIPRPGPTWDNHYNYPGVVCLIWSYAVSSLCRIFGDTRLIGGDHTLESHPRWRLRSVMIQQATGRVPKPAALHNHSTFANAGLDGIPPAIRAAHRDVELVFPHLTGKAEAIDGLDDAWGDVGKSQIKQLQVYWLAKLKGELTPFAYHPLNNYDEPGQMPAPASTYVPFPAMT